jgi:predicted phosphodiesterase
MRIAVVADVHGNLTALEAVVADLRRQSPDLVLHGGDLPASGARPAAVVDRIRELGWPGVCGNTDEMLWTSAPLADLARRLPRLGETWRVIEEIARHTRDELGGERMRWLADLPRELRRGPLALVHASPGNLWAAPPPEAGDADLLATYGPLAAPAAPIAVYAHIHRPFVRNLGAASATGPRPRALLVANTGSVSLSYDGDPRASYLLLDAADAQDGPSAPDIAPDVTPRSAEPHGSSGRDGLRISIQRVEYDVEREVTALLHARLPRADWLAATLRAARPLPLPERG